MDRGLKGEEVRECDRREAVGKGLKGRDNGVKREIGDGSEGKGVAGKGKGS